jgi:hypothetical protein
MATPKGKIAKTPTLILYAFCTKNFDINNLFYSQFCYYYFNAFNFLFLDDIMPFFQTISHLSIDL